MEKSVGSDPRQKDIGKSEREIYNTLVKSAILYGLETIPLTKIEAELESVDFKTLRFSLGMTRNDRVRNDYIRCPAKLMLRRKRKRGKT